MKHPKTAAASLLVLLGFAPASLAYHAMADAGAESVAYEEVTGTIQRVAEDGSSFVLEVEGREVTIEVNERTKYRLDGEESRKGSALKVGNQATVTHEGRVATVVDATSQEA